MNSYSIFPLLSLTINLSIAIIIFFDNTKDATNRWFSAFVGLFAIWNLSEIIILNSVKVNTAVFAAQILYRVIFLTPAFYVIVSYFFPRNFHSYSKKISFILLVFALPILTLIFSYPNFQIEIVPLHLRKSTFYYKITTNFNFKFLLLIFISILYFTWGSFILYSKTKLLKIIKEKNQTRFFLFGMLSIVVSFLIINIFRHTIVHIFHLPFFYFSNSLTFLISLFFLISVVHFKFLNIRKIRKGIIYSLLSSLILFIYIVVAIGINNLINQQFGTSSLLLSGVVILILTLLIRPLEIQIQHLIELKINKDGVSYRRNFLDFVNKIKIYMPENELFNLTISFLTENYNPAKIILFKYDESEKNYKAINSSLNLIVDENSYLINYLKRHKYAIEFYSIDFNKLTDGALLSTLIENEVSIILPVGKGTYLDAVIFLSEREHNQDYKEENLEQLTIFANEVSIALDRNRMIEKVKNQAVEKIKLQKLAELGQLTAGVAHEIRNPLNTISLSAQTLMKKNIDEETKNELLSFITDEVERLQALLNDFLKLSKINKINAEFFLIDDLLQRLKHNFTAKNTKNISFKITDLLNNRRIFSDFNLLYQILLNLIFNSYDSLEKKCETDENFSCTQAQIELIIDENFKQIIFKVIDNGTGIKDENIDEIFTPFFTLKEQGTGLGLAIVSNLVNTLNGKISVISGEKTIFTVIIPKKDTDE